MQSLFIILKGGNNWFQNADPGDWSRGSAVRIIPQKPQKTQVQSPAPTQYLTSVYYVFQGTQHPLQASVGNRHTHGADIHTDKSPIYIKIKKRPEADFQQKDLTPSPCMIELKSKKDVVHPGQHKSWDRSGLPSYPLMEEMGRMWQRLCQEPGNS